MTQMGVIRRLLENGWISLRQLGVLVNKPDRSIYGRQKTKNPVPTIRIGGIERVYTDVVIQEIEYAKSLEAVEADVLLELIRVGLRDKERKEKKDA